MRRGREPLLLLPLAALAGWAAVALLGRWWADVLLIAYIALFKALVALLFERRTRLGRAMAAQTGAVAVAFAWSAAVRVWPGLGLHPLPYWAVRVLVAAAVTWAAWEVLACRRGGDGGGEAAGGGRAAR